MKKSILSTVVLLMTTVVLTGCANINVTVKPKQDAQATDDGPDQKNEEKSTYDPADFKVSDVYEAPAQTPMDISGCDTFTQIVDRLDKGMGYADAKIWDTDVLLVSEGTYEWDTDVDAAIDAQLFMYGEDDIVYLGTVEAGGTAYPLAVKDGYLYVGGNHFMTKYLVDEGSLIKVEEGYVTYDKDGNDTYYYETCNAVFEKYDEATAKSNFEQLFEEQAGAEVIDFQTVGGR